MQPGHSDVPCCHVKSHYLSGTRRVHSVRLKTIDGKEYKLTVPDKTLIDPDLIRVEVIHYTANATLVRVPDIKDKLHTFWIKNK